ncbi:DUF2304 domain-containing protein [Kitasatospora kazusensis]|uniref:DUF2304 domain-containing protein n=1 Tax=Kitasatospora kazusensis TaxID=407974 RepID=A0ABP5LTL9_9ACTN
MKYFWIQSVLLLGVLTLAVMFIRRWDTSNTRAWKRLTFALFAVTNMYAVLRPADVSWVANRLGVGRGTDLVLYGLTLAVGFLTLNTLLRFRSFDRKLTELARSVAISEGIRVNAQRGGLDSAAVREPVGEETESA